MRTLPKTLMAAALTAAFAAAPLAQADAAALGTGVGQQSANQTIPGKANDAWITTKVKSEFATTRGVDATDIHVDTNQGLVTLQGTVANANEKMEAERVARSVVGVTGVDTTGLRITGAANADDTSMAGMNTGMDHDTADQHHALGDNDNQTVPGKANDAWITTKVKSELAANSGVDAHDINVDTSKGQVTLRGTVSGEAERMRAEQLARSVVGVKSVDTSGLRITAAGDHYAGNTGNANANDNHESLTGKAKDGWITTKVKSEFATTSGVDATDINVDTMNGRVTLRGTVASTAEKDKAERLARSIDGVTSVDGSGLRITGESSGYASANQNASQDNQTLGGKANDAWITTKVKSKLAASSDTEAHEINVDTNDGRVVLRGEVPNTRARDAAVKAARSIKGVKQVDVSGLSVATSD